MTTTEQKPTRTEVTARAASTKAIVDKLRRELTEARKDYIAAESLYVDKGTRGALEKKRDAGDACERLEILERRAVEAHEAALTEIARLDREDKLAELERLQEALGQFDRTLEMRAAEFVAIDRDIDARVMALAVDVRDAIRLYDAIAKLSNELRAPAATGARPDFANCGLRVRRALSEARAKEGRDTLAPTFLADAPDFGNWKLAGMSAEELSAIERASAVARQADHDGTVAARALAIARDQAAAAEAAKGKPKPEPPAMTPIATLQRALDTSTLPPETRP
jgi:hypothetical protein